MPKRRNIIIIIVILILLCIAPVVYFFPNIYSKYYIESRMHITLPDSAKVEKFIYNPIEDDFDAKISFKSDNSLEDIKTIFAHYGETSDKHSIPYGMDSMWNMETQKTEATFIKLEARQYLFIFATTRDIRAVISKDNSGQYYLYLAY